MRYRFRRDAHLYKSAAECSGCTPLPTLQHTVRNVETRHRAASGSASRQCGDGANGERSNRRSARIWGAIGECSGSDARGARSRA